MNPTWQIALTFAVAALAAGVVVWLAYDYLFHYRYLLDQRLGEISGRTKVDANASLFKDLKSLHAQALPGQGQWRTRLGEFIEQSGLKVTLADLLWASLLCGVVLGAIAALVSGRWWAAPLGMLPGLTAPGVYVWMKRELRTRRLAWQLPEAFDAIGRAIRAGQTVPAAFQIVADDFDGPIAQEFRLCYEQQNLGMSYDAALRGLARRTGIMELRILVVGLLVQSRAGGNLAELLSNLSSTARKRVKLQQKVRALTGEGRLQAAILLALPAVSFAAVLVLAPNYMAALLGRPWLIAAALAGQVLGAVWIRRIIHFEL